MTAVGLAALAAAIFAYLGVAALALQAARATNARGWIVVRSS